MRRRKRCGELSGANEKLHGTLAGNAAAMQAMSQTVAGLQRKADALAEVRQQHGALLEENLAMRRHCEVAVGDTQRADELDSEVLQLSGHAEQLQAQLEVLRERAACAEQDAHEARAGGVLLRARAAAALEEAGRKRCLGTALCRLFLFVGVRQRQRLAGLHDDLRFRHAQVKAQHLAVEEARDCLGEQVKAVDGGDARDAPREGGGDDGDAVRRSASQQAAGGGAAQRGDDGCRQPCDAHTACRVCGAAGPR